MHSRYNQLYLHYLGSQDRCSSIRLESSIPREFLLLEPKIYLSVICWCFPFGWLHWDMFLLCLNQLRNKRAKLIVGIVVPNNQAQNISITSLSHIHCVYWQALTPGASSAFPLCVRNTTSQQWRWGLWTLIQEDFPVEIVPYPSGIRFDFTQCFKMHYL